MLLHIGIPYITWLSNLFSSRNHFVLLDLVKKTELMPSHTEFVAMETFLEVLKPIVEITETLGGKSLLLCQQ